MLETMRNAWKVPEIRKKILNTLLLIVIFRLGFAIPVPFMDRQILQRVAEGGSQLLSYLDMLTGASFSKFNIFGLSIYPYISASIIIQLLAIAVPKLEELSKQGEEGRRKIAQYTRYLGLVLGFVEAVTILNGGIFAQAIHAEGFFQHMVIYITLLGGMMFLVWLGDLITEKGIGNGISILIFVGIISRMPETAMAWFNGVKTGQLAIWKVILFLIVAFGVVVFTVALQEGERKIPVQYAKRVVGRKMYGGQATHIPVKVNMAGVMPVIFAGALLAVPMTIAQNFHGAFGEFVKNNLTPQGTVGTWVYYIVQVLLIVAFAYFYTSMQFNTVEYAKNLQQNGGFVPGIRPGRPTSEYLSKISNRITFIGAMGLAMLVLIPTVLSLIFQLRINFGGTALLIVVGVVLETVRQLETMLTMRHYKGFLR